MGLGDSAQSITALDGVEGFALVGNGGGNEGIVAQLLGQGDDLAGVQFDILVDLHQLVPLGIVAAKVGADGRPGIPLLHGVGAGLVGRGRLGGLFGFYWGGEFGSGSIGGNH